MILTSSLRTIWIRFVEWNLSRARQPATGEMLTQAASFKSLYLKRPMGEAVR